MSIAGPAVLVLSGLQPVLHVWTGEDWEIFTAQWSEVRLRLGPQDVAALDHHDVAPDAEHLERSIDLGTATT